MNLRFKISEDIITATMFLGISEKTHPIAEHNPIALVFKELFPGCKVSCKVDFAKVDDFTFPLSLRVHEFLVEFYKSEPVEKVTYENEEFDMNIPDALVAKYFKSLTGLMNHISKCNSAKGISQMDGYTQIINKQNSLV